LLLSVSHYMIKQIKRSRLQRTKVKRPDIPKRCRLCVKATFNNTIINLTDMAGNSLLWESAGTCGFKGSKKKTNFAGRLVAEKISSRAFMAGARRVALIVNGPGNGRRPVMRTVAQSRLKLFIIKDVTPLPFNGCRPPKKRKV
jgi:small subunit ribosomal protein S11